MNIQNDTTKSFNVESGAEQVAGALSALASLIGGGGHEVDDTELSYLVSMIAGRAADLTADIKDLLHPA